MKKEKIEKIIKTLEIKKLELEIEKEIENEIERDRLEYHFNMIYGYINNEIIFYADYSNVINDFIWTYFSEYEKVKEDLKLLLDHKDGVPLVKKILNNVDLNENIFYNFDNEITNISINDLLFLVNNLIDFFKNEPCCINLIMV